MHVISNTQLQLIANFIGINESNFNKLDTKKISEAKTSSNEYPCFYSYKSHDCAKVCEWQSACRKLLAVTLC